MSPNDSDFMKRLQAMREGQHPDKSAQMPSLKERLAAGSPVSSNKESSSEAIKARIQAKFKKGTGNLSPTADEQNASRVSSAASVQHKRPNSAETASPVRKPISSEHSEEDKTALWTPENGGCCQSCGTYNLGHVVFCGDCRTMLLKTEEETVEIISSYPLKEIRGLVHTFADKLAKMNVHTTADMLRMGAKHQNRSAMIKQSGLSERSLIRLVHQSDLCRMPSIDPEGVALLELIGVQTLAEFKAEKPGGLYKKIQQAKIKLNQAGIVFLPTKTKVQTWCDEALNLSVIHIQ